MSTVCWCYTPLNSCWYPGKNCSSFLVKLIEHFHMDLTISMHLKLPIYWHKSLLYLPVGDRLPCSSISNHCVQVWELVKSMIKLPTCAVSFPEKKKKIKKKKKKIGEYQTSNLTRILKYLILCLFVSMVWNKSFSEIPKAASPIQHLKRLFVLTYFGL